jgi:hypothetical protein
LGSGDLKAGMNKVGEDGWELVSVDPGSAGPGGMRAPSYYFKRATRVMPGGFARAGAGDFFAPGGTGAASGTASGPGGAARGPGNPGGPGMRGAGRAGGLGGGRGPAGREPAGNESTLIITLKYAQAESLAGILQKLYGQNGRTRLATDERTNSIILMATEKDLAEIHRLVSDLDRPVSEKTR